MPSELEIVQAVLGSPGISYNAESKTFTVDQVTLTHLFDLESPSNQFVVSASGTKYKTQVLKIDPTLLASFIEAQRSYKIVAPKSDSETRFDSIVSALTAAGILK